MARTNSSHHGFSRATDAASDTFDFTLDHANLVDRLDAALRGVGASAAGGNLVNANANNAGKILSAAGDPYRGRVLGVSPGNDAYLVYQDNAGGTGTDKYAVGYQDSGDRFVLSYVGGGQAFGNVAVYFTPNGEFLANASANLGIRNRPFQAFTLSVRNNAGTIEHIFGTPGTDNGTPNLAYQISGATNTWTATPQSTGPFANGAALLSGANEVLVLNSPPQDPGNMVGIATVEYNDTGTVLLVQYSVGWVTVNGENRFRVFLTFRTHSGAAFALNTTNIPSGKRIRVGVLCCM